MTGQSKYGSAVKKSYKELNSSGLRVTGQRAIILDIIHRGGRHLDADEIYRRARKKEPRISLSTVYRTLQKFKDLGLVDAFYFDEDHHHYEAKNASEHHHLMCLGCGSIIEFEYDLINSIRREVPEVADFDIKRTELQVTGYCSSCREKGGNVSTENIPASGKVKEESA